MLLLGLFLIIVGGLLTLATEIYPFVMAMVVGAVVFVRAVKSELHSTKKSYDKKGNPFMAPPSPEPPPQKPTFKEYPSEHTACRAFVKPLETFLELDCLINNRYHYIALNKATGQLFEIHTRVLGFVEGERPQEEVLEFVNPPQELTLSQAIALAETKFEGIGVFYYGMITENLSLYTQMDSWYRREYVNSTNKTAICQTAICYEFERPLTIYTIGQSKVLPLVNVAEFLVDQGFVFENAYIGGGITEITHTGTVAYSATYTDLATFKNNFDRDLALAEEEADEKYGGWASVDYRYVTVTLKRDNVEVCAKISDTKTIVWRNIDATMQPLIDSANHVMLTALGDNATLKKRYFLAR